MAFEMPAYLSISADELGQNTPVRVRIRGDMANIAQDIADLTLKLIHQAQSAGQDAIAYS